VSTIARIRFANTDCIYDPSASTATKIECTLNDAPVCGSWTPIIYSEYGYIPVEANLTKIEVECTITAIHP
jgi:hypothetical protein